MSNTLIVHGFRWYWLHYGKAAFDVTAVKKSQQHPLFYYVFFVGMQGKNLVSS